jgi:excinuclease ABC subunit C
LGPCEGKQSDKEYNHHITQIRDIVRGKTTVVIKALKEQMMVAADRFNFEEAEVLRRKVEHLEKYQSRSSVVSPALDNIDVYGLDVVDDRAFANYFKVIQGSIVEAYAFQMKRQLDETPSDLLSYAILRMQDRFGDPSNEILVPFMPEYTLPNITYFVPQRGDKKKLLDLAAKNAMEYKNRILTRVDKHKLKQTRADRVLRQLMEDFRMKEIPYHIECFDNSNFQGDYPVASTVVFKDGKPSNKDYRHYHVTTVQGPNDFASMEEIVYRRYKRLLEEKQPLPQLVLIDGGKGQLNAALASLQKLGINSQVTLASIAKRLEEIYFPHDPLPLHISKKSESLKLLQQIRNEAHRFAITFHRQVRSKKTFQTELTDIPGIGEKTAMQLLQHFKSIKKLREADEHALAEVVGHAKAHAIYSYFTQNM